MPCRPTLARRAVRGLRHRTGGRAGVGGRPRAVRAQHQRHRRPLGDDAARSRILRRRGGIGRGAAGPPARGTLHDSCATPVGSCEVGDASGLPDPVDSARAAMDSAALERVGHRRLSRSATHPARGRRSVAGAEPIELCEIMPDLCKGMVYGGLSKIQYVPPSTNANGITGVQPLHTCAGPAGHDRRVGIRRDPAADVDVLIGTDVATVVSWSDTAIVITVPAGATSGCVGFRNRTLENQRFEAMWRTRRRSPRSPRASTASASTRPVPGGRFHRAIEDAVHGWKLPARRPAGCGLIPGQQPAISQRDAGDPADADLERLEHGERPHPPDRHRRSVHRPDPAPSRDPSARAVHRDASPPPRRTSSRRPTAAEA